MHKNNKELRAKHSFDNTGVFFFQEGPVSICASRSPERSRWNQDFIVWKSWTSTDIENPGSGFHILIGFESCVSFISLPSGYSLPLSNTDEHILQFKAVGNSHSSWTILLPEFNNTHPFLWSNENGTHCIFSLWQLPLYSVHWQHIPIFSLE